MENECDFGVHPKPIKHSGRFLTVLGYSETKVQKEVCQNGRSEQPTSLLSLSRLQNP